MTTEPALGAEYGAPPAPIAAAAPPALTHTDYTEVSDRAAYDAAVAAQHAPTPVAAPPRPDAVEVERQAHQAAADLRAEVDHEQAEPTPEYPIGAVAVVLEGAGGRRGVVHVLDLDDWPSDANSALQVGDFESWADGCLALDDYENVWRDLSPTLGQVKDMLDRWREATGQDTGKSANSPRALKLAARRSRRT